jgi:hypothetical protein
MTMFKLMKDKYKIMGIKVVHCRKEPYDIYIGRPRKGEHWGFGNPFVISIDGDRETVVMKFREWIINGKTFDCKDAQEYRREWILNNILLLKDKTLGCFCSPLSCHGDILKELCQNSLKNS